MTPLRILAAHLAVALREHRRRLRGAHAKIPPELAMLERWLAEASGPDSNRLEPTALDAAAAAPHHPPMLLTVRAAAHRLSVDPRTVERLLADGTLDSVRIGRARRVPAAELDRYVADLQAAEAGSSTPGPATAGRPHDQETA